MTVTGEQTIIIPEEGLVVENCYSFQNRYNKEISFSSSPISKTNLGAIVPPGGERIFSGAQVIYFAYPGTVHIRGVAL
jgi:cytidine deaminase